MERMEVNESALDANKRSATAASQSGVKKERKKEEGNYNKSVQVLE